MAINDNPSVKEALEAFVILQRIKAILSKTQTNPSVNTPKTGTGKRPMSEQQKQAIREGRKKYLERLKVQQAAVPSTSPPKSPPMPQNTVTKEANQPKPQIVKK